jgi:hypothetical protein
MLSASFIEPVAPVQTAVGAPAVVVTSVLKATAPFPVPAVAGVVVSEGIPDPAPLLSVIVPVVASVETMALPVRITAPVSVAGVVPEVVWTEGIPPPLPPTVPLSSIPFAEGTNDSAVEAPDVTEDVKATAPVAGVPPVPVSDVTPPPPLPGGGRTIVEAVVRTPVCAVPDTETATDAEVVATEPVASPVSDKSVPAPPWTS